MSEERVDVVEVRVRGVLARVLGMPMEGITDEASSETIATWDSLRHISLILELEEAFSVRFSGEEIVEMLSLKEIVGRLRHRGF